MTTVFPVTSFRSPLTHVTKRCPKAKPKTGSSDVSMKIGSLSARGELMKAVPFRSVELGRGSPFCAVT